MSEHNATLPRVGVIGAGGIGKTHLRAWAANGVRPAAIADARRETLDAAIAEHGGQAFEEGSALMASGLVDVVSICTPPAFHADLAIAAVKAGVAVICEKPMASTLAEAERMAEAVERTGTLFTVGFCHRFQPHIEALKRLIDDGELGTVMTFRNRFAGHNANVEQTWFANPVISGGGALADTSIHSIDLFRYLIGDPIGIHALMSTRDTPLGPALKVEDSAVLMLQTADGTIGTIEASWRTPPGEWSVTVYGTNGTAIVDYNTMTLRVQAADGAWRDVGVEGGNRFEREIAHFIDCWRGNDQPRVTAADGLVANRILDAAYHSANYLTTV